MVTFRVDVRQQDPQPLRSGAVRSESYPAACLSWRWAGNGVGEVEHVLKLTGVGWCSVKERNVSSLRSELDSIAKVLECVCLTEQPATEESRLLYLPFIT